MMAVMKSRLGMRNEGSPQKSYQETLARKEGYDG